MAHETEWEIVEKQRSGRNRPEDWYKYPGVAIGKGEVTFNPKFISAWLTKDTYGAIVLLSPSRQLIGLRIVNRGDEDANAFKIRSRSKTECLSFTCAAVSKKFPESVGCCYRAHKNVTGTVIEIEICRENMMK